MDLNDPPDWAILIFVIPFTAAFAGILVGVASGLAVLFFRLITS